MKAISEMTYEELSHMSIKQLREMQPWQRATWAQRIYEFENKKNKRG